MNIRNVLKRFWGRRDLPPEIYVSLVDSLYSDSRSLFTGSIAAAAAALITGFHTGEPALFVCALGLAVITCARAADMHVYRRVRAEGMRVARARVWEIRYVVGSAAYVLLLGVWSLLALSLTSDPFAHLLSVAITIAYMVGISGRNFGFDHLVVLQIACVAGPMATGLFLNGNEDYIILAVFTVPFFISLRSISARLRQTLFDAVIATRDMTNLARRFDTALNNMPHGLCMFDANGRLVVTNERMSELFGLPGHVDRKGRTARAIISECSSLVILLKTDADALLREFEMRLSAGVRTTHSVRIADGRTLDLTFQPMQDGGTVVLVEDSTERRAAEAKITQMARYDSLTGLINRTYFRDRMDVILNDVRGTDNACAVLFVDLDQFKQVNDTLGHPCGDELLRDVAVRLQSCVRENDLVARFGGDEFIVMRAPISGQEEAEALVQSIAKALSGVYEIRGHEVVIGTSIGVAMAPDHGMDADELLKNADMALYRAKFEGRGSWRFFKPEMEAQAQARRSLEVDLRNALAEEAFELHYQPLLNLKTKRISGCEALLRWRHPQRGMVSPGEFIPVAEEMGLIIDIGNLVIRKACEECTRWPAPVKVAVNLSAIQFERGDVANVIRAALQASGLPPARLDVEITESVFLQNNAETHAILEELQQLGVSISLDDFGTGYSSLSYLQAFPLNKVKIDRSFVKDLGESDKSLTLVRSVARLSSDLGLSVVVEGIETDEQLMIVAAEPTIDEAQGFLFSRPLPATQVRELLAASTPHWAAADEQTPGTVTRASFGAAAG